MKNGAKVETALDVLIRFPYKAVDSWRKARKTTKGELAKGSWPGLLGMGRGKAQGLALSDCARQGQDQQYGPCVWHGPWLLLVAMRQRLLMAMLLSAQLLLERALCNVARLRPLPAASGPRGRAALSDGAL